MFTSVLLLSVTAWAPPPATRVELLVCRTQDAKLQCVADIHVDSDEPLSRDGVAAYTIGYLARQRDGTPKLLRQHVYPVQRHALRRSIPVPLEALEAEAFAQPARVRLALFRKAGGQTTALAGASVMVALSEEVSLDALPSEFDWTPNPEVYAGGDGSDCDEEAIVVLPEDLSTGQSAQHAYIREAHPGAEVTRQSLSTRGERSVDLFTLKLRDDRELELCFDITAFHGERTQP